MILGVLDGLRDTDSAKKIGLIIAGGIIVLLIDWSYIYGPRAETLRGRREEVELLKVDLQTKRTKSDNKEEFAKEIKLLNGQVREAEARLPDEREIADLLSGIASHARAVGLDLTLFRQRPETYADFYARVPVEMNMRGTYHELAQFLDRVKRLDRIVNVANISVRKPRLQSSIVLVDASCTATTFRFLSEEERERIKAQREKGGKNVRTGA